MNVLWSLNSFLLPEDPANWGWRSVAKDGLGGRPRLGARGVIFPAAVLAASSLL